MKYLHTLGGDTIAAIATPPGRGGVGIVRVSGQNLDPVIKGLLGFQPRPRHAHFSDFHNQNGESIDQGIALFFSAPHSYTGENILELHGHGGTVVMDMLLRRVLELGARPARPGEFTERAYLNNKLDLAQAEAVIDLINSSTEAAARAAQKSLKGQFSEAVNELVLKITELRVYIEAAIDFVDEEIDFLTQGDVADKLAGIIQQLAHIQQSAQQGQLLQEGMTLVIAGRPNAGKSSLLNQLTGQQSAIVSDYAGTTRDILRENIQLDGIPLHILDTAGLHESDHPVEQEGIRRAQQAFTTADRILLVIDASQNDNAEIDPDLLALLPVNIGITCIQNKIDLTGAKPELLEKNRQTWIRLSANSGAGMDLLKQHLKQCCGYKDLQGDTFIARRRHLIAIEQSQQNIEVARQLLEQQPALELFAEELRLAQEALMEITGEFTADDLLGEIFSQFCIGK